MLLRTSQLQPGQPACQAAARHHPHHASSIAGPSLRCALHQPPHPARRSLRPCRAEMKTPGPEKEGSSSSVQAPTSSLEEEGSDAPARQEDQKLAALARQQLRTQSDTNLIQGALEEAQLIAWPTAKKAFLDTILVLAIVTVTASLLFGVNVVLAEGAEWWYHRG